MKNGNYKFARSGNPPIEIRLVVSDAKCFLNDVEIDDEGLRAMEATVRNARTALHVQKDLAKKVVK